MPILGNRLLKRQSVNYLLHDEFTAAAGSPLASPRTTDPGPGMLTFTQTNGQFSISSAKLNIPVSSPAAWNTLGYRSASSYARSVGRAFIWNVNRSSGANGLFFLADTAALPTTYYENVIYGVYPLNAAQNYALILNKGGATVQLTAALANATDYELAMVLRSAGALFFRKAAGVWTLDFVYDGLTATPLTFGLSNYDYVATQDFLRILDLPAPFTTDFGLATLNQASVSSGGSYIGDADGLYFMTVTAPNTLLGTTAIGTEMRYRVQDASNYWTCYLRENGQLRVDSVAGGVATNRLSAAGIVTNGASLTLCVITSGSKHNVYTVSGSTAGKRGSEIDVSYLDTQTALVPIINSGWAGANLRSWARTSPAYNRLG